MKNPLVSVLIPVYNVEKYVQEAILSIINQTYSNIEIVVIDDGSNDSTYKKVEFLANKYRRIKLFRNEKNLNIVKTLNKALKLSSGTFIARMDGDDLCAPDRIEKKVKYLLENPSISLVGCSLVAIDENDNKIGTSKYYSSRDLLRRTLKYVTPVSHVWVARRELYCRLEGYRELAGAEDYDFLLRMESLGLRYTNLEDYYGYYVRLNRQGNTVSSIGIRQRKLHTYVYKLFKEREGGVCDSYSQRNMDTAVSVSIYTANLYKASSYFLFKSIQSKANGQKFKSLIYACLSCISPTQVRYLIDRILYKRVVTRFEK